MLNTTYKYDHYFLNEEINEMLESFNANHSDIFAYESICHTHDNYDVWAVTITNKATGKAEDKPALYVDGNTHAGEVTGSISAMHLIDVLVTNYGKDEAITKIVDNQTVYVVPRLSPDGAQTYLTTAYGLRSVNKPHSNDDGFKQEDIDNNGIIAMMRYKDPCGSFKKSEDDSLCMMPRSPQDIDGEFYTVVMEGLYTGEFDETNPLIAKPDWGYDFNRNYPYGWNREPDQPGAGEYPLCNAENKAIVDYVISKKNIGFVVTNHTAVGFILYPPGTNPESEEAKIDMDMFKTVGAVGEQIMTYPAINIFETFLTGRNHVDSGAFDDWCYQTQGLPAYTIELWDLNKRAGIKWNWQKNGQFETALDERERCLKKLKWVQENAPESIVPWHKVNHPTLGEVEVGGYEWKFTLQNPPVSLLPQEVNKETEYMLALCNMLPKVVVEKATVKELGSDIYEVTLTVANHAYLSTNLTAKSVALQKDTSVKVSCDGNVVSGKPCVNLGDLAGFNETKYKDDRSGYIIAQYAKQRAHATFIVKADKGEVLTFNIVSSKGGKSNFTVKIQ